MDSIKLHIGQRLSYENENIISGTVSEILENKKDEIDELNIDQNALKLYLYDSDAMVCNIRVENHLPASQRYQGNYGVIFTLTDRSSIRGEETKFLVIFSFEIK